jgi:hypothetical protein
MTAKITVNAEAVIGLLKQARGAIYAHITEIGKSNVCLDAVGYISAAIAGLEEPRFEIQGDKE